MACHFCTYDTIYQVTGHVLIIPLGGTTSSINDSRQHFVSAAQQSAPKALDCDQRAQEQARANLKVGEREGGCGCDTPERRRRGQAPASHRVRQARVNVENAFVSGAIMVLAPMFSQMSWRQLVRETLGTCRPEN
eukprot:3772111-Pleurochrysis_carterae.AAC.2